MTVDSGPSNLSKQLHPFDVRLHDIRFATHDTRIYEFRRADGAPLPDSSPGAHIDILLPDALVRQYSLINFGRSLSAYFVGVKLDPNSRGGSEYIHKFFRAGQTMQIAGPRNNFPLEESAENTVFFAGGIGITPIWCMSQRLLELGKEWTMHYACRSRRDAVFFDALLDQKRARLHFDDENGGLYLNISSLMSTIPLNAHLYCCGPTPMLHAFEAATTDRPPERIHVEYFTAQHQPARDKEFKVKLASSGRIFRIPAGKTILEVLTGSGMRLPSSCEQGICGACEVRVLEGVPDHRDSVLTASEKAENKSMMICCSGSKSEELVLDL